MRQLKVTFRSPSFAMNNKVALIKDVRTYTSYGLKEAKDIVDAIFDSHARQTTISDFYMNVGESEFFRFEVVSDVNGVVPLAVNKLMVQLKYSMDMAVEERNFSVARKLLDAIELL